MLLVACYARKRGASSWVSPLLLCPTKVPPSRLPAATRRPSLCAAACASATWRPLLSERRSHWVADQSGRAGPAAMPM